MSNTNDNVAVNTNVNTRFNRFINIYRRYSYDLRNILLGFILVILGFFLIELSLLVLDIRDLVKSNSANITKLVSTVNSKIDSILTKTDSTMSSVDDAAKEVKRVSKAQADIYTDEKTLKGIQTALRSADDFSRIADNLLDTSRLIKRDLIPNTNTLILTANGTLEQSTKTIRIAGESIAGVGKDGSLLINESSETIKQLRTLLEDPNIKEAIAQAVEIEKQSVMLIANGNSMLKDIDENTLPALVANLKAVGNNTEKSTDEVLTFLKGINKPQSKKERFFKFLLESLLKSSPVLLKR